MEKIKKKNIKNYLHAPKQMIYGQSDSCQIAIMALPEGLEVPTFYLTTILAEEGAPPKLKQISLF